MFFNEFSRCTNQLSEKLDGTYIALHNLCGKISTSNSKTTTSSTNFTTPNIKLNDANTLIDGLKQLFFLGTEDQQLQLLTMAPPDWGRKKIESFFGCTEHQSKQAIVLRDKYGILSRPVFFYGSKETDKDTIEQVLRFYEDDDVSWQ